MSLNPVNTKFLRSSHPIPPAPTTKILAVLTLVPKSDSNTGFDILKNQYTTARPICIVICRRDLIDQEMFLLEI